MDPLSAVLAFTGLSASLITLIDATIHISKKLVQLQSKLNQASSKILQLQLDVQNLRSLLEAIQSRLCEQDATDHPPTLRTLCDNFVEQLKKDLLELQQIVERLASEPGPLTAKRFKAEARQVLAESTIADFQGRIATHIGYLGMVQTLIYGDKIDSLCQDTTQVLDQMKALFELVFNQRRLFESSGHLSQTLGIPDYFNNHTPRRGRLSTSAAVTHFRKRTFDFGFGRFSYQLSTVELPGEHSLAQKRRCKKLRLSFLAPFWLSQTALLARINLASQPAISRLEPMLSLQPLAVNQNPELLEALHCLDTSKLIQVFRGDKARPTDMVMDFATNEPLSLLDAFLPRLPHIAPCSRYRSKHLELLAFMASQRITMSPESVIVLFLAMDSNWSYDQPQKLPQLASSYLQTLLACDASLLTACSPSDHLAMLGWPGGPFGRYHEIFQDSLIAAVVEGPLGFEGLSRCLFHPSQLWTLEDISGRGRWYMAVLFHTNPRFQRAVLSYVHRFRSTSHSSLDSLLSSYFCFDNIIDDILAAEIREECIMMQTLATKGTPQMLAAFLEAGLDLDQECDTENYLAAAAMRNPDPKVFEMLLEAGASTARAIPHLCTLGKFNDRGFREFFPKVIDRLKTQVGQVRDSDLPDPLTATLKCDRALEIRPDTPQMLINGNLFLTARLHGSHNILPYHSYIFWAIYYNRVGEFRALLDWKPPMYSTIDEMFAINGDDYQPVKNYTWLTLAVEIGRPQCVQLIISHADNQNHAIHHADGADRTSLQMAQSYAMAPHPRPSVLKGLRWVDQQEHAMATASADEETLLILQAANGRVHESGCQTTPIDELNEEGNRTQPKLLAFLSAILYCLQNGPAYALGVINAGKNEEEL